MYLLDFMFNGGWKDDPLIMLSMPQTALKENKGVYGITQSDILSLQYRLKSTKNAPQSSQAGLHYWSVVCHHQLPLQSQQCRQRRRKEICSVAYQRVSSEAMVKGEFFHTFLLLLSYFERKSFGLLCGVWSIVNGCYQQLVGLGMAIIAVM